MGRSDVLERQPRQKGKADHNADRDNNKGAEIARRGPLLPEEQQQSGSKQSGDNGAS
jgi:hypothetical protein